MTVVKILGRDYRVRNADDPEHVVAVAAYVDQVLREIQRSMPDTHEAAILAAMNIASELLRLRDPEQPRVPEPRLQAMIDLLESV